MKIRKPLSALLLLVGLVLAGCATQPAPAARESAARESAAFDPGQPGTAWEEWIPHENVNEWWYLTAVVAPQEPGGQDPSGTELSPQEFGGQEPGGLRPTEVPPYLLQFTIFHLDVEPGGLYMLHLACSDYGAGRHLFEQYLSFDPREAGSDGAAIRYGDSRIELSATAMRVQGEGRDLSMDLTARISEAPVWHGGDGIISMGHPEDPGEDSFYYSMVRMDTNGTLTLRGFGGELLRIPVSGASWFDRQWGRFRERGWDWFSLRFFDGDRVMLFAFPTTGHREATYVRADGRVSRLEGFDYEVERWVRRGGDHYGLGWRLRLPVKDGGYRVVPLHTEDFNPNLANDYWEGLCRLLDDNGRPVGWCVVETTAPAHTP